MQKFILVDIKYELAVAWSNEFSKYENFEIHGSASIFDYCGDALVSPANSFGFMDGGIDLVYSRNMGWDIERRLQEKIRNEFDGELLVGQATSVETNCAKFPILISAPTMRVPAILKETPNVYLAAKAIFLFAKKNPHLETIVCPGLGTGCGMVAPEDCALRMRMAYEDF